MDSKLKWNRISASAFLGFAALSLFALPAQSQTGAALYKTKCAACHGPDGSKNKAGDLASEDAQKKSDDELAGTISAGKSKMPAYGKSLKPDQIKDLVAYIRTFKK
jgi:cytochrome c6